MMQLTLCGHQPATDAGANLDNQQWVLVFWQDAHLARCDQIGVVVSAIQLAVRANNLQQGDSLFALLVDAAKDAQVAAGG